MVGRLLGIVVGISLGKKLGAAVGALVLGDSVVEGTLLGSAEMNGHQSKYHNSKRACHLNMIQDIMSYRMT